MRLASITQLSFRNLSTRRLDLPEGLVAFVGGNGAGKSNLLTAAYLGCNATLPHGTNSEMVSFGAEEAYVAVDVEHLEGTSRVEVGIGPGRKVVKLDSQTARASDVARVVSAVLMTPEDSDLVHGAPSSRRAFLDATISKVSARYSALLREYNRALEQRNALLRLAPRDPSLEVWTARLVAAGSEVDELRERLVRRLSPLVRGVYAEVSGDADPLEVRLSRNWEGESLAEAIATTRAAELARGATAVGPHRDDLVIALGDMDLRSFGSRGEARTAALAMRVGEYLLLEERHAEPPVLLVDDFSAELDRHRREYLLALTARAPQAVVTGTEAPPRHDALFTVEAGRFDRCFEAVAS